MKLSKPQERSSGASEGLIIFLRTIQMNIGCNKKEVNVDYSNRQSKIEITAQELSGIAYANLKDMFEVAGNGGYHWNYNTQLLM